MKSEFWVDFSLKKNLPQPVLHTSGRLCLFSFGIRERKHKCLSSPPSRFAPPTPSLPHPELEPAARTEPTRNHVDRFRPAGGATWARRGGNGSMTGCLFVVGPGLKSHIFHPAWLKHGSASVPWLLDQGGLTGRIARRRLCFIYFCTYGASAVIRLHRRLPITPLVSFFSFFFRQPWHVPSVTHQFCFFFVRETSALKENDICLRPLRVVGHKLPV